MRLKFIDHSCLRLKWGKVIFVIPFMFWNKYIPCDPFLSLNNFSFIKKSRLRSHPTLGASEISMIKKNDKAVRKPKGKRAQETQVLGGMPKSQEKVITKIKWVCSSKAMKKKKEKRANQRRAAKENMNDVKSQTIDSDLQSLKPWNTLWALWILFFHSQKHSPHYVPVEVLSNQASKKPRTINNALKMQRIFFS